MVVAADSAYKTTEDDVGCLALKGYLIMLVGSDKTDSVFPGENAVCWNGCQENSPQ